MGSKELEKLGLSPLEELSARSGDVEANNASDVGNNPGDNIHPDFYDINCPMKEGEDGNGRV